VSTILKHSRSKRRISFKESLEKKRIELEELMTIVSAISEFRLILSQTIKNPDSPFGSEQNEVPILNPEESLIVKEKMMSLIKKYL